MERSFPCLCGKGEMLAEWSEHDTFPNANKYITWSFECADCRSKYVFPRFADVIILKSDADTHSQLQKESTAAADRVYAVAAPKYEEEWVKFVASQQTKAEMSRLVNCGNYGRFLKSASKPGWIEGQSRGRFKAAPKQCLDEMRIVDAEVEAFYQSAEAAKKSMADFWDSVEKKRVPFR